MLVYLLTLVMDLLLRYDFWQVTAGHRCPLKCATLPGPQLVALHKRRTIIPLSNIIVLILLINFGIGMSKWISNYILPSSLSSWSYSVYTSYIWAQASSHWDCSSHVGPVLGTVLGTFKLVKQCIRYFPSSKSSWYMFERWR